MPVRERRQPRTGWRRRRVEQDRVGEGEVAADASARLAGRAAFGPQPLTPSCAATASRVDTPTLASAAAAAEHCCVQTELRRQVRLDGGLASAENRTP
jgi:hypothetical protein